MDTKCFQYVMEICECGSINKAANKLGILQPNYKISGENSQGTGYDREYPIYLCK